MKRFLAILIAFVMIFSNTAIIASDVIATDEPESASAVDDLESAYANTALDELIVIEEITELREENVKHFSLSDGTSKAVLYSQPVHYLDENGKWIDIDNALTLQGNEYSTSNKFKIKFANKSGSNGLLSIKDGEYKIDFTPLNTNKVDVEIENPQENNSRIFDDVKVLQNLVSRATYSNIYNGVDIEYVLVGNNIKENIIVNTKQSTYSYTFELKLSKLTAELSDGSIIISDSTTKEALYEIPAPYMLDANGAFSNNVEYSLEQTSKWEYTFTVTASADWINAEDRAFPVTIDPSVVADSAIMDTYTSDYTYNGVQDNNSASTVLFVGEHSHFGDARAYIKFDTLPSLPTGAVLTHAVLSLHNISNGNIDVGAYRITGNWQDSTIQYSSNENYLTEENPVDHITVSGAGNFTWDITKIAKYWYENGYNYGICLKAISTANACANFASSENTSDGEPPMLEISYYYAKGIIDYHTHFTSSAGVAGVGYIDSFSGNIYFVHSITSTIDEIMPYSIGITYDNVQGVWINSFDETITRLNIDNEPRYLWTDGDGSVHSFAPYKELNFYGGYVYYQFNENGTKTLVNTPTIFYDEEGLGLNLSINASNEFVIKDDKGNQKVFSSNGKLARICDTLGNVRAFNYNSSGQLISISLIPNGLNSSIEQLVFTYNNGNLFSVENKQTKVIAELSRSANKVYSIRYDYYNEDKSDIIAQYDVLFEYDTSSNLVLAKDEKVRVGIAYEYNSDKSVSVIREIYYDNESFAYASMGSIEYGTKKTVYRSSKTQTQSSEDIITTYTFDNSGRVITVCSSDIDGKTVYGAANYEYNNRYDSVDSFKKHNSVKYVLDSGINTVNLIKNPTFNDGISDWQYTESENSSIEVVDLVQNDENFGKTLRIYTTTSSETPLFEVYQSVYLYEGIYTLSASINKRGMISGSNVKLVVRDSNGAMLASSQIIMPHENNTSDLDNYWEKLSVQFNVSTNGTYKIYIEFEKNGNVVENLYVDNVVLERGTGFSGISMYENGDFNSSIEAWDKHNADVVALSGENERIVKATSNLINQSYVRYSTIVGEDFNHSGWIISAWAKADNSIASANTDKSKAKFAIKIVANLVDSNETIEKYVNFNTETSEWQYVNSSLDFIELNEDQQISTVDVYLCYDYNVGYAYFDKVSFCQSGRSFCYEYNGLGNVTSITDSEGNSTVYEYEGGNAYNVTSIVENTERYNAYYDSSNNISSIGSDQYSVLYSRNSLGQINAQVIGEQNNTSNRLLTSSTYYLNSNLSSYSKINTHTDERGNVTTYLYDEFGRLKGTYLNDDEGILYTYNAYGQTLTAELAKFNSSTNELEALTGYNISSIIYSYGDDLSLSEIKTPTVTYIFEYDIYGNITALNIGNRTLTEYFYEEFNGNLESVEYGNGATVYYAYDELDRLIGIKYDQESSYTTVYTYASNGNLSTVYDEHNNTTYYYYYDANSKLTSERAAVGTDTLYDIYYTYDSQGRLTNKSIYYPGHKAKQVSSVSYEYNDRNLISKIINSNAEAIEYTYDVFNRISNVQKTLGSTVFENNYTYAPGRYNDGDTSWLIDEHTSALNGEAVYNAQYTYDDRGNIISIEYGGDNGHVSYEYDDKNQLIRENNQRLGYTYLFTYDNGGNLRYKETREFTLEPTSVIEPTMPLSFESYSVNSSSGDAVTRYTLVSPMQGTLADGSITYDGLGNPLTYYNGASYSFTWTEGRLLASATVGAETYSFKYNQDGIRVEKIANGIRYEYFLEGTRIIRQTETSLSTGKVTKDTLFYYDQNGYISSASIYIPKSNGSYAPAYNLVFLTNIQGDVISIYNTSGTKLVEFTYDAWGNFISNTVGGTATEKQLALETPFRYRSYYFDRELQLYYLNSRYYDARLHRFINADSVAYLGANGDLQGFNLYAYCSNNPVMFVDFSGHLKLKDIFGFGLTYEKIIMDIADYYFFYDFAYGKGVTYNDKKPVNFIAIIPEDLWRIWDYSLGLDFHNKGKGFQIYIGTDVGISWYNEDGGTSLSFDGSGRFKIVSTVNNESGHYDIVQTEINTHNIFGTIMVAIFAPQLLPALAGVAFN